MLFHHDPLHSDDFLDRFHETAEERWTDLGGPNGAIEMAAETQEIEVEAPARVGRCGLDVRVAVGPGPLRLELRAE